MPALSSPRDRFIPAWAGNTLLGSTGRTGRPVHPRVGGEHASLPRSSTSGGGSSPRGRGTLAGADRPRRLHRFIPAWAGNTSSAVWQPARPTVHPRVGGEHLGRHRRVVQGDGSSPRGRGTPLRARHDPLRDRFIPAWAGNTIEPAHSAPIDPVHPRVGGEHRNRIVRERARAGSSPRGRGTRQGDGPRLAVLRFIPAWAGNTSHLRLILELSPVHPRVGGEHRVYPNVRGVRNGSSPRGRGTQRATPPRGAVRRFIPAWAGNTHRPAPAGRWAPVHPRVGGEHDYVGRYPEHTAGSSPQVAFHSLPQRSHTVPFPI